MFLLVRQRLAVPGLVVFQHLGQNSHQVDFQYVLIDGGEVVDLVQALSTPKGSDSTPKRVRLGRLWVDTDRLGGPSRATGGPTRCARRAATWDKRAIAPALSR